MNQIYTAGYSGHIPDELKSAVEQLSATVLDIRLKPVSRIPGWSKMELSDLMGAGYMSSHDLGNVGAFDNGSMRLLDEEAGLKFVLHIASTRPVILLCGCADFASCHRKMVSDLLAKRGVQTQELEWPVEVAGGLMPCISLWQPYASLIAIGAKQIETRHWATSHRGPIAIHAAKRTSELHECASPEFWTAFESAGMLHIPDEWKERTPRQQRNNFYNIALKEKLEWLPLPLGAVVAVADLTACTPTEELLPHTTKQERTFGNFMPNRFGWELQNVRALREPIPIRGAQGLFRVSIPEEALQ